MSNLIFTFDPDKHKYTVNGNEAVSVTTILQKVGITKDYGKIPKSQQKFVELARERGNYYDKLVEEAFLYPYDLTDWQESFLNFLENNDLEIIAVQVRVGTLIPFTIAGTLDLIIRHKKMGKIYIVDFKATALIYRNDVMWQTNAYSFLIPNVLPQYKHEELGKAVLHYHEDSDNFTWLELDHIPKENIERAFQAYQLDEKYNELSLVVSDSFDMVEFSNLFDEVQYYKAKVKEAEENIKVFEQELMNNMAKTNTKTIETQRFRITYTPPGERRTVKYKELLDSLEVEVTDEQIEEYTSISKVKDKLTITERK